MCQPPVALVTGAAGGIGSEIVRCLARDGYAVALSCLPDDTSLAAASEIVDALRTDSDARAIVVPADVRDSAQVQAMAARVRVELGAVTSLVCNAATSVANQQNWRTLSAEDWSTVLAVNVTGAFLCIQAVYDDLAGCGFGSVVVMSSVAPLLGRAGNLHYVSSKAALVGLTRALAREVGEDGVRVNAVAPGAIRTSSESLYGDPDELAAKMADAQALRRRGNPSDIASAVRYLLSAEASFVTGQLLVVDGGWVMH